jgi:hypothetical protein
LALGLLSPLAASAEVNCKFVMKNLSLPERTVESVAETMGLSEQEVQKCKTEAEAQKAAGAAAKPAEGNAAPETK